MARLRFTGRFSAEMRRVLDNSPEKPLEEKPTQRGPETLQTKRERLVKEALAVHRSQLRLGVERPKVTIAQPEQKLRVDIKSPRKK